MKKYVEMTVEEALEYSRGNKNMKVLVMVSDMESTNDIAAFARSSTASFDKRYDLLDSVDDMFKKILEES